MRVELNPAGTQTSATESASSAPAAGSRSFWSELVSRAAEAAGVNPALALRVAARESGLNPGAVNASSGAIGIMQLMPGTAAGLNVNPHHAVENIKGGVEYLRQQLDHFGNMAEALAAYNWGPANVTQALARWGSEWLDHAPAETRAYVAGILGGDRSLSTTAGSAAPPAGETLAAAGGTLTAERAQIEQAMDAYLLTAILE
ncbi:MAG: lytic transglycosylase domain-containing protein [Terriglobia bacterium]